MQEQFAQVWLKIGWRPALVFLLLPVALAFFNQPTIDDYWYTFMVKENGFWQAQVQWNKTINARFTSNAFMSLNSLVWGKTWFFKVFPIALIVGYLLFFRAVAQQIFTTFSEKQLWHSAIVFCSAYAIGLPGYYEGFFWSSALAGYQLSWLCLFSAFLFWFVGRHHTSGPVRLVLWLTAGVIVGGFHELIGFFALGIAICIGLFVRVGKKNYNPGWLWFAVGAMLAFVFQAISRGNYEKAQIIANKDATRNGWVFIQPFIQFGYHLVRGFLLNPMWWVAMFIAVPFGPRFFGQGPFYAFKQRWVVVTLMLLFALAIFPTFFVGVIEGAKAPLRVVHLGYGLLFLVCLPGCGLLWPWLSRLVHPLFRLQRFSVMVQLFLVATLLVKTADLSMPLISGTALQYNSEVESRFATIQNWKGREAVAVSCLKAQPMVLCPVDICDDPTLLGYLERVFRQKIVTVEQ